MWKKFDIETVSFNAIRSKVVYLLNKYKKNNKHKNPNQLPPDYEKVLNSLQTTTPKSQWLLKYKFSIVRDKF